VVHATDRTLDIAFSAPGKQLTLVARIEPNRICEIPFQFPIDNLYQEINQHSVYYQYHMDSVVGNLKIDGNLDEVRNDKPFFMEFAESGSGHPSDKVYGWVRNDDKTLYVALDFTGDNTMDGAKDYAKVYVNTLTTLKVFKASVLEQTWGLPGFAYTDNVTYEHKIYEFAIPLAELGGESEKLGLAFAVYGTCAPPCDDDPTQPPPPPPPSGWNAIKFAEATPQIRAMNEALQIVGICCGDEAPFIANFAFGLNPPAPGESWFVDANNDRINDRFIQLLDEEEEATFFPTGINIRGSVAGGLNFDDSGLHAAEIIGTAVINLSMGDLPQAATDINDHEEVIGYGQASCRNDENEEDQVQSTFVDGTDLGDLIRGIVEPGNGCVPLTSPVAINLDGDVLVNVNDDRTTIITTSDDLIRYPFADGFRARDFNDNGFVIGTTGTSFNSEVKIWDNTTDEIVDIHGLLDDKIAGGNLRLSTAASINNKGQVVGTAIRIIETVEGPAALTLGFVYLPGADYGLDAGVHFLSGDLTSGIQDLDRPLAITDAGIIMGVRPKSTGHSSAYILTPKTGFNLPPVENPLQEATILDDFSSESGEDGDPVNTYNGRLTQRPLPDFNLRGPISVVFERFYSSGLDTLGTGGAMGMNWRHTYESSLNETANFVTVTTARGKTISFRRKSEGFVQTGSLDVPFHLAETADGFVMGDPTDNRLFFYRSDGKLDRIEDRNRNAITVSYIGDLLSGVSDGFGRSLDFDYNPDNLISRVSDGDRDWQYDYRDNQLIRVMDPLSQVTEYQYGNPGEITATIQPLGNIPYSQIFDNGKIVTQTDAFGNATHFDYNDFITSFSRGGVEPVIHTHDNNGTLSSITDGEDNLIEIGADNDGRRNSVTNASGNTTATVFDPANRKPVVITDPYGATSLELTENVTAGIPFHDPAKRIYPDGYFETITTDSAGNYLTLKDRAGHKGSIEYSAQGLVTKITTPLGAETTKNYNTDGTLAQVTGPNGNTRMFEYDGFKRLIHAEQPDGSSQQFDYDVLDRLLSFTNEIGVEQRFEYDANGNIISTKRGIEEPDGSFTADSITVFEYDAMDRVSSIRDAYGNRQAIGYDEAGRIQYFTDQIGNISTYQYDKAGRVINVIDPLGHHRRRTYTPTGLIEQALSAADADNGARDIVTYQYDELDRLTHLTDAFGNGTEYGYDVMNRVTSITDPSGAKTILTYGPTDLISEIIFPEELATAYSRNALGLITSVIDPNGQTWSRTYDLSGRITMLMDPIGNAIHYSFTNRNRVGGIQTPLGFVDIELDGVGNVLKKTYSDGTVFEFTYDLDGQVTGATSAVLDNNGDVLERQGSFSAIYDKRGLMTNSNGLAVIRDAKGNIIQIEYTPGQSVHYTYDANGNLVAVHDFASDGANTLSMAYDTQNRLRAIIRSNGITTRIQYQEGTLPSGEPVTTRRVIGIKEEFDDNGTAATLALIELDRDARGHIVSANRNVPQAMELVNAYQTFAFNAASEVEPFIYDAEGRLVDDGSRLYEWDLASRLTGFREGTRNVSYVYDAMRNIVRRTDGSTTENYVWNYALERESIAIRRLGGVDEQYYVYSPAGNLLYSISPLGYRHFYHYDESGNTIFLSNDAGILTDAYAYTPYGLPAGSTGSTRNPFTYQGRFGVRHEPGTALYHMRARYFDAKTRRFLSRDPLFNVPQPLTTNPYLYAGANPLTFHDPSGEAPENSSTQFKGSTFDNASGTVLTITSLTTGFGGKALDAKASDLINAGKSIAALNRRGFLTPNGTLNVQRIQYVVNLQRSAQRAEGLSKGLNTVGNVGTGIEIGLELYKNYETAERLTKETISIQDANLQSLNRQLDAIQELMKEGRISVERAEDFMKQAQANFELSQQGAEEAHQAGLIANALIGAKNALSSYLFRNNPVVDWGTKQVLPEDPELE